MFKNITNKKRSLFTELLITIATPTLILTVILLASFWLFHYNYKETIKDTYLSSLEQFCIQQDNAISSISHSVSVMSENSRFLDTIEGNSQGIADITYAQRQIDKIMKNHTLIDSISIVEKSSMRVFTQHGIFTAQDYFTQQYKYDNYDLDYWLKYKAPLSEKTILSPSTINQNGTSKNIIPVVFTRIGDKHLKNIVIVNIDIKSLVSSYEKYSFSENSTFYVVNRGTQQIFGQDYCNTINSELFEKLSKEQSNSFDYANNGNCFVISYTPKRSALGYTYVSMIPYKDINKATSKFVNTLFLVGFIFTVMLALLILFLSKKTYSPFHKIIQLYEADEKASDIDSIHHMVENTITTNKKLSAKLSNTLPIVQEQHLIHILNSSNHYFENKSDYEEAISFEYNYFCSIIIRFQPKETFHTKYSTLDEKKIELGLFDIISQEFSLKFKTYIIQSNAHTLYILLNLESPEYEYQIKSSTDYLHSLLSNDIEDITLSIACGDILEGVEGLKTSHSQALEILSGTQWIKTLHINVNEDQTPLSYKFSLADENTLYNHLQLGNFDAAINVINDIIKENTDRNIHKHKFIQLYVQIFNVVFKAMRSRNINYDENDAGDIALISDIISHDIEEIHNILLTLIDKFKKSIASNKVDIDRFLEYIHGHYAENETLEKIAQHFGTSAPHLSRLIKKETSSTFTEYINTLRINEAKQLLQTTDKTITEIYEQLGFNNRNTFIRLFKSMVGVTPSEYRKKL